MQAPEIETIRSNAEHGKLLAHTMWIKARPLNDVDEEARLFRLMMLFEDIQDSVNVVIKDKEAADAIQA